ncbi:MAG TPA: DOMON-like domain-containing protein [Burkholderiales bacterium]|nr:DOMON-like domain-containing protein [Burkholderiales bacterium]
MNSMPSLACHPESPCRAVRAIDIDLQRTGGTLLFAYRILGTIDALRLPPRGLRPLWQHTCCEAFVARPGKPAYHEFNFSPSGDWAAYAFTDYRDGTPMEIADPGIAVKASRQTLELTAALALPAENLLLGLSAVIEERDGTLSYWALRHAPGRPDFHNREAFALELA